jgi:prophage regulatory protein
MPANTKPIHPRAGAPVEAAIKSRLLRGAAMPKPAPRVETDLATALIDSAIQSRLRRFLSLPKVCEVTGLKRAAVYQKISEGTFPRQIRISSKPNAARFNVVWLESEIADWQEARIAERDRPRSVHQFATPEAKLAAKQAQHGDREAVKASDAAARRTAPPVGAPPIARQRRAKYAHTTATATARTATA